MNFILDYNTLGISFNILRNRKSQNGPTKQSFYFYFGIIWQNTFMSKQIIYSWLEMLSEIPGNWCLLPVASQKDEYLNPDPSFSG